VNSFLFCSPCCSNALSLKKKERKKESGAGEGRRGTGAKTLGSRHVQHWQPVVEFCSHTCSVLNTGTKLVHTKRKEKEKRKKKEKKNTDKEVVDQVSHLVITQKKKQKNGVLVNSQ